MATAQFHLGGRKPLHPKNTTNTPNAKDNVVVAVVKQISSKPKKGWKPTDDSDKENLNLNLYLKNPPKTMYDNNATTTPNKKIEAELDLESSLAEELSSIRKKMERLKLDKEKTEKVLKERDSTLDFQLKEMGERGQIQKQLEMEVDRLFRLKELQSYCMRISPIKSLRDRQQDGNGRKMNEIQSLKIKGTADWEDESVDENTLQSPAPSDSSEIVRDNND